jgi:ABC-type multidrug transport system ATPase subunit
VGELHRVPDRPEPVVPVQGATVLALSEVVKGYRGRTVLGGVGLTVRVGEVAAIVGANGSGKSTLLRICAGLLRPDSGAVARRGRVGFVPQDGGTIDLLTPHEHFRLFGAAAGLPPGKAISTGNHLAAQLSWRPHPAIRAGQLSGGTRRWREAGKAVVLVTHGSWPWASPGPCPPWPCSGPAPPGPPRSGYD